MKNAALLLSALALCIMLGEECKAESFRCGNKLVSTGDRTMDVIATCGPPDWKDEHFERRLERIYNDPYRKDPDYREPIAAVVEVRVEEWFYNSGPHRFIRILRFENSVLVNIETGGYGY
jgi:hypothetical protein